MKCTQLSGGLCPFEFSTDLLDSNRHLEPEPPLARLELVSALDAVLDRIPRMRLADTFAYERVRFFMMQGAVRLDVEMS